MIKRIIKIIVVILIFLGLLGLGGYSFSSFKHSVGIKNPGDVYEPLVDNLPDIPDIPINTPEITENTTTEDNDTTTELPTELEPVDVNLPQVGTGELSKIEIPTNRNIRVTINGNSLELNSTTTVSFIKWLANNYSDNKKVEYEELEVKNEEEKDTSNISYNDILESKEDLDILVSTIKIVDKLPEYDDYDRNTYEKPIQSYNIGDTKYNRNDYAWKTSEFLISEEPFEYVCPYTGETITDESKLDYDHIVPLKSTYIRGAKDWTYEQRNEYAYNQYVGVDVYNSANRSKSDKGPTEWLPNENIEDYCYSWLLICSKYNLVMTEEEVQICVDEINIAIENGETIQRLGIEKED